MSQEVDLKIEDLEKPVAIEEDVAPSEKQKSDVQETKIVVYSNMNHKEKLQDKVGEFISPKTKKFFHIRSYINSVLIRVLFVFISSYQIFFLTCIYNQQWFYVLYLSYAIFILDGIWVIWKNSGSDHYW